MEKNIFEFINPITESHKVGETFSIRGVAINSTITRNGIFYSVEELEKAGTGFSGRPILVDHENKVRSIAGRVKKSFFNPSEKRIEFEAEIMDETIQQMITDGRIQDVSIGASVEDLVEQKDGSQKAVGIEPLELSLVAVPADSSANLMKNVCEKFRGKILFETENKKVKKKDLAEIRRICIQNYKKERFPRLSRD